MTMKNEIREYVIEKTRALIDAPTCSAETKEAALKWLDAAVLNRKKMKP